MPVEDLGAAAPEDEHGAEGGGEIHGGRIIGPGEHDPEGALAEIIGALGESLVFVLFADEGFDLADALEIVHEQGVHGAGGAALGAVAAVGGEGVPEGAAGEEWERDQRDGGQGGLGGEEDGQHAEYTEDRDGALFGAIDEDAFDGVDVFDHPGHEIARGPGVEVTDRQPLEVGVDGAAEIEDDVLFEDVVDPDPEAGEQVAEQKGGQQGPNDGRQQFRLLQADDVVDDELGQFRKGKGK